MTSLYSVNRDQTFDQAKEGDMGATLEYVLEAIRHD